jgi:hypothetical protein
MRQGWPAKRDGDELTAAELNAIYRELERRAKVGVGPGMSLSDGPMGVAFDATATPRIYARLTGTSSGGGYPWKEVEHVTPNAWRETGRVGSAADDPAYDASGRTDLGAGDRVYRLRRDVSGQWVFQHKTACCTSEVVSCLTCINRWTAVTLRDQWGDLSMSKVGSTWTAFRDVSTTGHQMIPVVSAMMLPSVVGILNMLNPSLFTAFLANPPNVMKMWTNYGSTGILQPVVTETITTRVCYSLECTPSEIALYVRYANMSRYVASVFQDSLPISKAGTTAAYDCLILGSNPFTSLLTPGCVTGNYCDYPVITGFEPQGNYRKSEHLDFDVMDDDWNLGCPNACYQFALDYGSLVSPSAGLVQISADSACGSF